MQLVKLTKTDGTTRNGYSWAVGTTHTLPNKENPQLCTNDVFHAYQSAEVAAFMRHFHAYEENYRAWIADGFPVVRDNTKVGVFSLTIVNETELPSPTLRQTVLFAMLCAAAVLPDGAMAAAIEATRQGDYADAAAAARAAYADADADFNLHARAAYAAADAAAYAAAYAAADAAAAAAYAADAAAYADAADAAAAAYADAADAAAHAAAHADAAADFDLHAIAVRAMENRD